MKLVFSLLFILLSLTWASSENVETGAEQGSNPGNDSSAQPTSPAQAIAPAVNPFSTPESHPPHHSFPPIPPFYPYPIYPPYYYYPPPPYPCPCYPHHEQHKPESSHKSPPKRKLGASLKKVLADKFAADASIVEPNKPLETSPDNSIKHPIKEDFIKDWQEKLHENFFKLKKHDTTKPEGDKKDIEDKQTSVDTVTARK